MENKQDTKKNNKYLMYMHAGSGNHGCEAIVKSLCSMTQTPVTVLSHKAGEDKRYGLDKYCSIVPTKHVEENFLPHVYFYLLKKLFRVGEPKMKYSYSGAGRFEEYDYAISIGGDNYCYDDTIYDLKMANSMFCRRNIKTALVGCSIEPELLLRDDIIRDMRKYSVIVARESISYDAICEAVKGSDKTRVCLVPDPAFTLKMKECELPEGFDKKHTIGINVSPLILNYEKSEVKGVTLENYEYLIESILSGTEDRIALIPHVIWTGNDDREPLKLLYEKFKDSGRVILVEDHSASELKYIISCCRLFIGARTHATIAAYSSGVPTLVVGYSVKSRGIARDLFGTEEHYVLPVQNLNRRENLAEAYRWIEENYDKQKHMLEDVMPEYIERARHIWDEL